ncbi:MAG: type II secretion system F family protein [Candidatus Aenigmatarchaeota archaeon]
MPDSFRGFATAIFGGVADKYANYFTVVKDNLPRANMKITFRTYMSMAFMMSAISFIKGIIAIFVSLSIVPLPIFQKVMFAVFVPIMIAMTTFFLVIFNPYQIALSRKRSIETNLPFVLTHMGAVASSGVPPYVIFKLIGQFDEYGEIAKEMRKIVNNIDAFGIDPLSAVRETANKSPSEPFKQVLMGFVSTTESGGDIKNYLKSVGTQALFDWKMRREKFLQQLDTYAEFYTGLLIAAPLFIIALFAVLNLVQGDFAGYDILDLMKMTIYMVVPLINGSFLLFLKGMEVEM